VTSGKYEKDEDGNEVWVETRTQTTSTVTIGENGEIGEVRQSSSGSRTVFEVVEGLQATSPFSATPTDIKGKRLSSTKLDVPRSELSEHFRNLATTQSEYAAAGYGDSYNFRNSTAMRTNATNAQADGSMGLSLVGCLWGLTESNTQTYFDQYRNSSVPASKTYATCHIPHDGKVPGRYKLYPYDFKPKK
jgi:hypothetical protein